MKPNLSLEVLKSSSFGLLVGKFDVSLGQNCSFFNLEVPFASNENKFFHSEKSNGKHPSKDAADPFVSVDNQEIYEKRANL